jgi:hypothetical protein
MNRVLRSLLWERVCIRDPLEAGLTFAAVCQNCNKLLTYHKYARLLPSDWQTSVGQVTSLGNGRYNNGPILGNYSAEVGKFGKGASQLE